MAATIKDVAKKAEVSPSTVSRVIANNPRISQDTHEKVRKAMKELGYHPNAMARGLVKQKSQTIGLFISTSAELALSNPFFVEAIRGIGSVIQKHGYSLLLHSIEDEKDAEKACLSLLRQKKVDGVVLSTSRVNDKLISKLQTEGYPFVVIGRPVPGLSINWVNNDNIKAAYEATEYLLKLGHQQIAMISGPEDLVVSMDRAKGYKMALQSYGLPFRQEYLKSGPFTQVFGQEAMKHLLSLEQPPTAVLVADDLMAFGGMETLKTRNLSIPGDMSIVGFNDSPLASFIHPALTSVNLNIHELGTQAAKLLMEIVEKPGHNASQRVIPTQLIIRESCGSPGKGGDTLKASCV